MRRYAIGCPDARLHRVLTTRVRWNFIRKAASITSSWQSVLIDVGFCVQPLRLIVVAGAHRRVFVTHGVWLSYCMK